MVRADKGVDVLLEAARLLKQRGAQFLIRIVGEFASEEYRQQLVGQIEASELEERVDFCGPKVGEEKWELFNSADIFCFPSYYSAESFGNVLLEAMMFRLPVVSTHWRGIPDIVVDSETGFLVAIKDAEATAAKLAVLLTDKTLRERLGENGRTRYLENFTVAEYLQKHREVVLEVAAKGRVRNRPHREKGVTQRRVLTASHSGSRQVAPSLPVLGVNVSRVDYDRAVEAIIGAAKRKESFGVGLLAVHGVMEAHHDRNFAELLNRLHLVTPDGQPVRWALNLLGARELKDRVYGPTLTLKLCERAAAEKLPVFLYGSRPEVIAKLSANLKAKFPDLIIAGTLAPPYGQRSPEENEEDIRTINASGARIVFVGLGCPRQEKWVALHLDRIQAAMIAVGAAFDFHAGTVPQAPRVLQDYGLEWFFRLLIEPKRLWRRYLILNPLFVLGFSRQLLKSKLGLRSPVVSSTLKIEAEIPRGAPNTGLPSQQQATPRLVTTRL
jgi:exopolysaccharide biosynthesis WecB/TagA/CpsF family protein